MPLENRVFGGFMTVPSGGPNGANGPRTFEAASDATQRRSFTVDTRTAPLPPVPQPPLGNRTGDLASFVLPPPQWFPPSLRAMFPSLVSGPAPEGFGVPAPPPATTWRSPVVQVTPAYDINSRTWPAGPDAPRPFEGPNDRTPIPGPPPADAFNGIGDYAVGVDVLEPPYNPQPGPAQVTGPTDATPPTSWGPDSI